MGKFDRFSGGFGRVVRGDLNGSRRECDRFYGDLSWRGMVCRGTCWTGFEGFDDRPWQRRSRLPAPETWPLSAGAGILAVRHGLGGEVRHRSGSGAEAI